MAIRRQHVPFHWLSRLALYLAAALHNANGTTASDSVEQSPQPLCLRSRLQIYVYDMPAALLKAFPLNDSFAITFAETENDCSYTTHSGYNTEFVLADEFAATPYRTHDPGAADFFFVPHYYVCLGHRCDNLVKSGRIYEVDCSLVVAQYTHRILSWVSSTMPYFNRSAGADHVMVHSIDFASNMFTVSKTSGLEPRRTVRRWLDNMVSLQNLGFMPSVDSSYPPSHPHSAWTSASIVGRVIVTLPGSPFDIFRDYALSQTFNERRDTLIQYRGSFGRPDDPTDSRGSRQALALYFGKENRSDVVFSSVIHSTQVAYLDELVNSVFCLYPEGGHVPWSGKLPFILNAGCIPVIISDGVLLPFEPTFPWRAVAVKLRIEQAQSGRVEGILRNVSTAIIRQKLVALHHFGLHFVYFRNGTLDGAFCHVLAGLYNMKPRQFLAYTTDFD